MPTVFPPSPCFLFLLIPHPHVGTVLARLTVFPVIVKGQREAAKLNNVLPEMTKLTNRMNEAKQSGNRFDCKNVLFFFFIALVFSVTMLDYVALVIIQPRQLVMSCCLHVTVAKAYSDLNLFQKKHDVNPLRGFLVPLVQVSLSLYTGFLFYCTGL